jgi:retinol dehydrogenase-12
MAHHLADDGILTFSLNPGGIKTELQREMRGFLRGFLQWLINFSLYPAPMGAITQLHAGTSPKLTKADNGKYFIPWAREAEAKKGMQDLALAEKLWDYLETETTGKY